MSYILDVILSAFAIFAVFQRRCRTSVRHRAKLELICFYINHLSQRLNYPFIKTVICFLSKWFNHFEWIVWMNESKYPLLRHGWGATYWWVYTGQEQKHTKKHCLEKNLQKYQDFVFSLLSHTTTNSCI